VRTHTERQIAAGHVITVRDVRAIVTAITPDDAWPHYAETQGYP
jgi:hypothetical protein